MFQSARPFITVLFLLLFLSSKESIALSPYRKQLGKSPLFFIENKGQVKDQNGKSRSDIDFKLETRDGLSIFIGKEGLHYLWNNTSVACSKGEEEKSVCEMNRIEMELLGANMNAEIIREDKQDYYETYYTPPFNPNKGCVVHTYRKITYKNIYPNIDWVLHISTSSENLKETLEYDFIVHPGGNVSAIQLRYNGANKVSETQGSLLATGLSGTIFENPPFSFQLEDKKTVASNFTLRNNIIGFNVSDYTGTLVVDPTLEWATYFGGGGITYDLDQAYANSCDAAGNALMCGRTMCYSNIATTGAYQDTYAGVEDAFIVKFSNSGARLWSTYYGGSGDDQANGVTGDAGSNIYISGMTESSSGIASTGAYQSSIASSSSYDAFLAKFDSSGALIWATYYGGNSRDCGYGLVCDAAANVYMAGYTSSTSSIASPGSFQGTLGGVYDVFLVKFDSSGSRLWGTYYGGNAADGGNASGGAINPFGPRIAYDGMANVYLASWTTSTNNIATSGSYQSSMLGNQNAFLAKFGLGGNRVWGTYYGGLNNTSAYNVACDGNGGIYITGETLSPNNIATPGAYQSSFGGTNNGFLAKFSSAGAIQWASYFGDSSATEGNSVKCDSKGSVYMTGYTMSNNNVATVGAYQTINAGSGDAYLVKFSSLGAMLWGTYYGGSGQDFADDLAIDQKGSIYMTGGTTSTNNIASQGAYQTSNAGGWDAFLAKFEIDTFVFVGEPFADTLFCAGDTFGLAYNLTDTFANGNVFTVQLSDSAGSFSGAVNIGTATTSLSGSISCTIPFSTIDGQHYRIRILSTNPIDTSKSEGVDIRIRSMPYHSSQCNSPLCTGDTLKLRDSVVSGSAYNWWGPNSFGSIHPDTFIANLSLTDSGLYFVSDTFQNGCYAIDTLHVIVKPTPAIPVASSNGPLCASDSLKLYATDSTSGASWQWIGPASFLSYTQNPIRTNVVLTDSGKYRVRAILNGCSSAFDTTDVSISPVIVPSVSISSSPNIIIPGHVDTFSAITNCSGASYQWYINGNAVPGATNNPYLTLLAIGDHISVKLHCSSCANPDTAVSNSLTTVGIAPPGPLKGELRVYPNPVSESLSLSLSEGEGTLYVYNAIGQLVYSSAVHKGVNVIDTRDFADGVYVVQVVYNDGSKDVVRVVK